MNRGEFSNLLDLICILVVSVASAAPPLLGQPAGVIYVDDDAAGANDGSSWADAFNHLQDALAQAAVAAKPVQIRVAQGVYRPDRGAGITPGDQTATFQLLNGATLKGGYAGVAAPDPDACDPKRYESILSGDLKGDDNGNPLGDWENSCCVVLAHLVDETAVMNGFTISGCGVSRQCSEEQGNAVVLIDAARPLFQRCRFPGRNYRPGLLSHNGSALAMIDCEFDASGIRSLQSSCVLIGCLFRNGGLSNRNHSNASVTDCLFDNAGMATDEFSTATVTGCTFQDCEGGALSVGDSELVLMDCLFQRNGRDFPSAGSIVANGGNLRLMNCSFLQNRGHVIISTAVTVSLSRCSFVGNSSRLLAPLWIRAGSLTLRDCEFIGNSVQYGVGAVEVSGSQLRATGCVFAGNSGGGLFGAGAIFSTTALLSLSNCTFVGNRGTPSTIECWTYALSEGAALTNSIVWGGPNPLTGPGQGPPYINVTYSDIQGGYPGEGNIDVDPCFVAPGFWADPNDPSIELGPQNPRAVWVHGDYHLQSQAGHWNRPSEDWVRDEVTSPCIDAGDPRTSVGLEPFPNGGVVNMGAYGGTVEASKSYFGEPVCETQIAGDLNGDCKVDATDQAIASLRGLTQETGATNLPPTLALVSPKDGDVFQYPTPVSFHAVAADADGFVIDVQYIMEHRGTGAGEFTRVHFAHGDAENDWKYTWEWWGSTDVPFEGVCTIRARALDSDGVAKVLPEIKVTLLATN